MIDDQRTIRRGEQLAQTHLGDRLVTCIESRRAFKKLVILNRRALWQFSSQLCDFFTRVS